MPAVTFDPVGFVARYPEFSTVSTTLLAAYFAEAGLHLNNTDTSIVTDLVQRGLLLNMLTAHLTAINAGVNGSAPTGLVGRISTASQGSVSATADYAPATGTMAWYVQTPYGAAYWAATARYRAYQYQPYQPGPI